MYRRPKFLQVLLDIRREMALEAHYDVDLFAELARTGARSENLKPKNTGHTSTPSETETESVEMSTSNGA